MTLDEARWMARHEVLHEQCLRLNMGDPMNAQEIDQRIAEHTQRFLVVDEKPVILEYAVYSDGSSQSYTRTLEEALTQ